MTQISSDVLLDFFNRKVKVLLEAHKGGHKRDILMIFTELFVKLNVLLQNIRLVTVKIEEEHSFISEDRLVAVNSPEKMAGMPALWEVLLEGKDSGIAKEMMSFLVNMYIRPEMSNIDEQDGYVQYMREFVDKVVALIEEKVSKPEFKTDEESQRVVSLLLTMVAEFIDKSESRQIVKNVSLSSFYKGKSATLTIDNKISTTFNTPKTIEIKVAGNTTIQQIKQMVSKEIKRTTWKNIKLFKGYKKLEIQDRSNSRNLRDLGISLGEKFYSEYRSAPAMNKEELVIEGAHSKYINPKASRAFKIMFQMFAKDDRMGPEELVKYTEAVLDEKNIPTDYYQIKELLSTYDKTRKGYLSEEDFLTFYTDACFRKSQAVWQNLRTLNFSDQLILNEEEQPDDTEELARDYIMSNGTFANALYHMTETVPSLAELSWGILSRLPPIQSIIERITSFKSKSEDSNVNWEEVLDSNSTFKALYNLFIVDYLLDDTNLEGGEGPLKGLGEGDLPAFKRKWRHDFITNGGFNYLFSVLKKFINLGTSSQHDVLLLSFILRSVKSYILAISTLTNSDIYPCVAFIGSSSTDFSTLMNHRRRVAEDKVEKNQTEKVIDEKDQTEVAPSTPDKKKTDGKTKEDKQAEALKETPEFIEFREAVCQTGEEGMKAVDVTETLRFLVRLCESVLTKTENLFFEELTIVELSLNIIFCFLLYDVDLLKRLITTETDQLLSEGSPLKIAGHSDFLSFLIAGLLNKRGFMFVKYFDNAFKVLLHEAESKDVQTLLVQVVFENALKEGLPLRNASKHIELAAQLLENICSEKKEAKLLLTKSDLTNLVDLRHLFREIFQRLFTIKAQTKDELYYETELLSNSFKILEKVLSSEESIKKDLVKDGSIKRLFSDCLFNSPDNADEKKELVCKSYFTRNAAFDLLTEACKNCPENLIYLYSEGLTKLSQNLPKITNWSYTPSQGRKSDLGYVGIFNPACVCYMNAMLQQFYMTPTFRYGILMANDYLPADMVEVEGRTFDDNLFHQLQRMFGYLDRSERRDFHPSEFCLSYKDITGMRTDIMVQQDTKEFLDVIFDRIETSLKPTPFKSLLQDVYGGKQINEIECSNCGDLRTREELFYNLSIEVKNLKAVNEGIQKLITEDIISDYRCDNCKQKCDVIKRTFLKECPNVLLVHLQRIIFDLDVLMNVKINTWYEFQQFMNLNEFTYENYLAKKGKDGAKKDGTSDPREMSEDDLRDGATTQEDSESKADEQKPKEEDSLDYNLAGVIVHLGSAEMGHYYSYININRGDPSRPKV